MRVAMVELPLGFGGPVVRHRRSSELVYVIEGSVSAFVGDDVQLLHSGMVLFIAAGTPHGFKPHAGPARLIVVHSPGISPHDDHERLSEDFDAKVQNG